MAFRAEMRTYTEEDIVIKAIWERQTFTVHYRQELQLTDRVSVYLPDDEDAYYGRG